MKLGMSTAAFYSMGETEENALHLRSFPQLDTCEVFLESWSEYCAGFAALVRENLQGLHVTSVHPKGTQFEPDLFARSARQVEDAMKLIGGVFDAGQVLGASWYVMHGPGTMVSQRSPENINCLAERVERMQGMARERGMEILWENVSWCTMRRLEELRSMQRLVPDMNYVLDIKQAYRAGVDPMEMLALMGDHLRHVHVLDYGDDGKLCLPGEGVFDWRTFFTRLKEMGYQGSVILEPYEYLAHDDERLSRSLDFLRGEMA